MSTTNIYLQKYKTKQNKTRAFNLTDKVSLGGSIFLIERHFIGNRDFRQAIFAAVKNEAKRMNMEENTPKTATETA